jgi:hypothetical protein
VKLDAAALRRGVRSGWVPAVVTLLAAVVALLTHGVSVVDVARFSAYVLLGLALPGLVLWRLLVHRPGSTLVGDTVYGITLAIAVELVVYVACGHAGHPGWARVWPLVPLALFLVPACRRRVWRRAAAPQPLWWSWGMAGLLVFALTVLTKVAWAVSPLTSEALRRPYVDIPYQLSLVSALSRRVKADLPFVQGEPLYYHWFDHAHLAAEAHATAIEPVVLLSRLDMILVVAVVLVGSATLAQRVSRSPLAGLVATGVLTLGGSALIWPHFTPLFLNTSAYISPTTTFACAVLVGCVAITVELVDPDSPGPPTAWVAAALLVAASSGAKGSALPVLLAGWVSLLLMALLLRRRVNWPALGLLALGVLAFLAAQKYVYGPSKQGTAVLPFGLGGYIAHDYGLVEDPGDASVGLRGVVVTTYLVIRLSSMVAIAGLFTPRTWRHPWAHFLVGAVVGGAGATMMLDSATRNQVYFLLVTPVFVATAVGWGLVELLRRVSRPVAVKVLLGFLAAGALTSLALLFAEPQPYADSDVTLPWFVAETLLLAVVTVVIAVVMVVLARSRPAWRHAAPLACAAFVVGLGVVTGPLHALDITEKVSADDRPSIPEEPEIALGGIQSARWLRDHSSPDAVVATNSHCRFPAPRRCDHRAFWISAYSERQVLVEGWSYTSRSSDEAAKQGLSVPFMDFWDQDLLTLNNLALIHPTRQRLERLHRHHGVTWLFVDKRYQADLPALKRLTKKRMETENYAVFELR